MKKIFFCFVLFLLSFISCNTQLQGSADMPIDLDGDGYFDVSAIIYPGADCDDTNPNINPGVTEILFNGIDDDCNPLTLDDDLDGDGFGVNDDCDDTNAEVNPDAIEIQYNGIDDDCNTLTLDDDLDGDGYTNDLDCNEMDANINPGMTEIPYNGIDDDCDPLTLDNDLDGDGYNNDVDCDDTNADVNPGAEEIFTDDIDNNCNGVVGYVETVLVACSGCKVGNGPYYTDANRRAGRVCAVFDSDSAAAAAGYSPCTETGYID